MSSYLSATKPANSSLKLEAPVIADYSLSKHTLVPFTMPFTKRHRSAFYAPLFRQDGQAGLRLATFLLDMSAAPALSLQTISKPCYTLPNLFPAICFCRNKMERSTFSPRSYSSRANAISHPLTLCYTQVPAGQAAPFYVLPLQADTCQPIYLLFGPLSPSGLSAMFLLQARQVALPCVLVIPLFRLGKHRFPFLLHLDSNKTNRRIL